MREHPRGMADNPKEEVDVTETSEPRSRRSWRRDDPEPPADVQRVRDRMGWVAERAPKGGWRWVFEEMRVRQPERGWAWPSDVMAWPAREMPQSDEVVAALAQLRQTAQTFDGDNDELSTSLRAYADDFERRNPGYAAGADRP